MNPWDLSLHHAPTSSNPFYPKKKNWRKRKEIRAARLAAGISCRFRGLVQDALLDVDKLLVDGQPIESAAVLRHDFRSVDTALKGGTENDGTAWCISLMSQRIRTSQN